MPKTSKVKLTLEPHDAAVVAPVEFWDHLVATYRELANREEDEQGKAFWMEAVDHVNGWVEHTLFTPVPEEDDDWN